MKHTKQENMLKATKISSTDNLRLRVANLKTTFRKGADYIPLYIYEFGEQTEKQVARIRAVWNLRETDEDITKNLEKIAKKSSKS